MKSIELKNKERCISPGVFLAVTFSSGAYAQKADFLVSTVAPEAKGYVDVKTDSHMKYLIKVEVSELEEAKKLIPAKPIYVVWMVTEQPDWFFSKKTQLVFGNCLTF